MIHVTLTKRATNSNGRPPRATGIGGALLPPKPRASDVARWVATMAAPLPDRLDSEAYSKAIRAQSTASWALAARRLGHDGLAIAGGVK